ncbi:MAG: hypothetical protein ABI557_07465 [Aureliella sp.]
MPLDQYSPCPCGSGKKMKFCKCVEQPQDYEKLIRLIEGGQELAAMDRINQMLAKTPNAAWLLAIKGELALGMQELDSFKETANRFLKLKPDNPLALIMKSLASSLDEEPVENAAHYLLDGLAESRESLPAMALLAIDVLLQSLAKSDKLSLAGYWGEVQQMLQGDQRSEEPSVLQDQALNLITKVPTRLIDDPPGAAWKERLAEVVSLSRIFSFSQAETKLRSILRDFPDQPGPLSQLLRAQMAQLNQSGAHTTACKLAEHLELTPNDRAYFSALSYELASEQPSLQTEVIWRYAEIDSLDRVTESFAPLEHVEPIEGQIAAEIQNYYAMLVKDDVPARRVYTIFDGPVKSAAPADAAANTADDVTPRTIATAVATVVLFAKQTDKPARALLLGTQFPPHQLLVDQTLELLQLGNEIELSIEQGRRTYVEFISRPKMVLPQRETPTIDEAGKLLIDEFLQLPLKIFDGATPREAAEQERFRGQLAGLLCHLEGEQGLIVPIDCIANLYQQLGVERPANTVEITAGNIRITNIIDLDRLDLSQLSDAHLQGVLVRAMNLGASRVFYHCSMEVRNRASLADNPQMQIAALSGLKMLTNRLSEKIDYCSELVDRLQAVKAPVGKVVVELVQLLVAAGRTQEAEKAMMDATIANPEDPYLMSFMQYAMQQSGRGGMPAGPRGADADELAHRLQQQSMHSEPSGGLVLPGQENSAATGESKLWLPGS